MTWEIFSFHGINFRQQKISTIIQLELSIFSCSRWNLKLCKEQECLISISQICKGHFFHLSIRIIDFCATYPLSIFKLFLFATYSTFSSFFENSHTGLKTQDILASLFSKVLDPPLWRGCVGYLVSPATLSSKLRNTKQTTV